MTEPLKTATGWAAFSRNISETIKTPFALAALAIVYYGTTMVALAVGDGELASSRLWVIAMLAVAIFILVVGVFLLRIFKPISLSEPPQPEQEDVTITGSKGSKVEDWQEFVGAYNR